MPLLPRLAAMAALLALAVIAAAPGPAAAIDLDQTPPAAAPAGAEPLEPAGGRPGEALEPVVIAVRRGDTLLALLARAGLAPQEAHATAAAIAPQPPGARPPPGP